MGSPGNTYYAPFNTQTITIPSGTIVKEFDSNKEGKIKHDLDQSMTLREKSKRIMSK